MLARPPLRHRPALRGRAAHCPTRPSTPLRATGGLENEEQGAGAPTPPPTPPTPTTPPPPPPSIPSRRRRQADSTDAVSSFLTRRFGIVGGLAWLGVLTAGSLGEQVKTRLETAAAEAGTKAVADAPPLDLGGGVVAQDLRVGGGDRPVGGLLAVLELAAWPVGTAGEGQGGPTTTTPAAVAAAAAAAGPPLIDTADTGKPLVLLVGGRPLTGGLCPGAEAALLGMRAGGKRLVVVPASAGFGERGTQVKPTRHAPGKAGIIPPGQALVYSIELLRVSVPPS